MASIKDIQHKSTETKGEWLHVHFFQEIPSLLQHINEIAAAIHEGHFPPEAQRESNRNLLAEIATVFHTMIVDERILLDSPPMFAAIYFHTYFFPLTKITLQSFCKKEDIDSSFKSALITLFEL